MSKRILIYRIGAIGDVVHSLAFVKYLRTQQPDAHIDYLTGSKAVQELLIHYAPYINKVWLVDKNLKHSDELQNSLKTRPADEFVYLHSNYFKAWYLNLTKVKAKKLIAYKANREFSAVCNYALVYFPELKSQLENQKFFLPHHNLEYISKKSDYICLVPGVGKLRPHRAYPLEKWVDLIKEILAQSIYTIKILGGPDELELSQELDFLLKKSLSQEEQARLENLIGQTQLTELVPITANAQRVYSADTGILHIAAASGATITSIFTITAPERFAPYSPHAEVLQGNSCLCSRSHRNRPKHCENLYNGYAKCAYDIKPNP